MELQHITVKVFVEDACQPDLETFINIFHAWIQKERLDELLIDVADYRHVRGGPEVLLVTDQADYCMDSADERLGMVYSRKGPANGSAQERIGQALSGALKACRLLESEYDAGNLRFSRQNFEVLINDRAIAPNTEDTHKQFLPDLENFVSTTFGCGFQTERETDARRRYRLRVQLEEPFELESVLKKLS